MYIASTFKTFKSRGMRLLEFPGQTAATFSLYYFITLSEKKLTSVAWYLAKEPSYNIYEEPTIRVLFGEMLIRQWINHNFQLDSWNNNI